MARISSVKPLSPRATSLFQSDIVLFPDIKQAIDKVERVFADTEDLRKAIMLAAAYELIE
jgi:hypothetical protein